MQAWLPLRKEAFAHEIQIAESEEGVQLEIVLWETPIPHLREVPEILEHMKRMLHF